MSNNYSFNKINKVNLQINEELQRRIDMRFRFRGMTPFANAVSGLSINNKTAVIDRYKSLSILNLNNKTNALSDITTSYEDGIFRPKPGITQISSEYKNKFGSVRKIKIEWMCSSKKILEELSPYFLTLGNTVYLEWGWSSSAINSIMNKSNIDYTINNIRQKIKELKDPLFDAVIGIITNFGFVFNNEGSFTCFTELTSVASIMESLTTSGANISPNILDSSTASAFASFKTYLTSGAFYEQIADFLTETDVPEDVKILYSSEGQLYKLVDSYRGNDRKSYVFEYNEQKDPLYISWGYIEDYVLGKNYNIYIERDGVKTSITALNSEGNKLKHYPYIRSSDLGVCIYPVVNTGDILDSKGNVDPEWLKIPHESFNLKDYSFNGEIRKILINTEFFRKTILSNNNLLNGLSAVLNRVSQACGDCFDFIITQNESNGINWSVVSLNYYEETSYEQMKNEMKSTGIEDKTYLYDFNIRDGKSFIIDSTLKTSMTNVAALNVFYESQGSDEILHGGDLEGNLYSIFDYDSKLYTDLYGFGLQSGSKNPTAGLVTKTDAKTDTKENQMKVVMQNSKKYIMEKHEKYGYKFLKRFLPVSDYGYDFTIKQNDRTDTDKEVFKIDGEEGMRFAVSSNIDSTYTINNVLSSAVPIDLTIMLDGIAGFNITDAFKCNYIHSKFNGKGVFQIVGITDTINRTHWSTQLKVNFRAIRNITENLYRYYLNPNNNFWDTVKIDKAIVVKHQNRKQKTADKAPDYTGYGRGRSYGGGNWQLPVPRLWNGMPTIYHDTFRGYQRNEVSSTSTNGPFLGHRAIDITGELNTDIICSVGGIVSWVGYNDATAGNYINIVGNGLHFGYLHMSSFAKTWKLNDKINAGDLIGYMGDTGSPGSVHLHFMVSLENDRTHVLNPMFYLYDKLGTENLSGIPYATSAEILNCKNTDGGLHNYIGTFSDKIDINGISDYAGKLKTDNSNNIDSSPLLIVIGGYTSSDKATRVWAEGLKNASSILKDFKIVAYDYGNKPPDYSSDHLGMTQLASQINAGNPAKIYIVGHSSGAFAAYYLIRKLNANIKSNVKLFVLDQGDGLIDEEKSAPNAQFDGTVRAKLVVCSNGNYKSLNYDKAHFNPPIPVHKVSNNSATHENQLHSGMIVTKLNYGSTAFTLNENYRNAFGGNYITEWID